jgi:methyltransferase
MRLLVSTALVAVCLALEAIVSRRHERELRRRGAVEPSDDPHRLMRVVYPACFAAMIGEGLAHGPSTLPVWWSGLALFVAAKALKAWAIIALGPLWSFRVLVLPAHPVVMSGPYRFVRHPNYVAVVGELLGACGLFGAWLTGPVALVVFGGLLRRRIAVEERALTRSP